MVMRWFRYLFTPILFCSVQLYAGGILYQHALQSNPQAPEKWTLPPQAYFTQDGLRLNVEQRASIVQASRSFAPDRFAGKLLRLSAEAALENVRPGVRSYEGASLQFTFERAGKRTYGGIKFPNGTSGWKRYSHVFHAPAKLDAVTLKLLFQNSSGQVTIRNLSVEELGTIVDLTGVANMELSDPVAGDGAGGWTDQGPEKDARAFRGMLYANEFAGIPLATVPTGKNVLAMHSPYHLPRGPKSAEISLDSPVKARFFYLLHTAAWSAGQVGSVTLTDVRNRQQTISIQHERDVHDWYRNIAFMQNGFPALRARSGDGQPIAAYVSKFAVDPSLTEIRTVTFQAAGESIWLILAATLADQDIPLPEQKKFTIHAGERWLPFSFPENWKIQPGSALDLEKFLPVEPIGQTDRIVIRNGKFVRENQPDRPLRFLACAVLAEGTLALPHAELDEFVREVNAHA